MIFYMLQSKKFNFMFSLKTCILASGFAFNINGRDNKDISARCRYVTGGMLSLVPVAWHLIAVALLKSRQRWDVTKLLTVTSPSKILQIYQIQWNPSCGATPFASEKWHFKRGGLSLWVEMNTFMFRITL